MAIRLVRALLMTGLLFLTSVEGVLADRFAARFELVDRVSLSLSADQSLLSETNAQRDCSTDWSEGNDSDCNEFLLGNFAAPDDSSGIYINGEPYRFESSYRVSQIEEVLLVVQ